MQIYTILVATDASTLSSQVNQLLTQGWQSQGGVCVATNNTHDSQGYDEVTELWAQAMVKTEKGETQ